MVMIDPGRPESDEYSTFFASYIERVPDGSIIDLLQSQLAIVRGLLAPLSHAQAMLRPTPDDWTILDVIGHLADTEQVFAYRALHIGRGDLAPLAGFDQDDYARNAHSTNRTLEDLLDAYESQRRATLALLRGLDEESWRRRGMVAGYPSSARVWAYVIAGHELHHIADLHTLYKL